MILANPKPKNRARIYERLMSISHHLRGLNDYGSLYAVISGMRETSVERLSQTHKLVVTSIDFAKEFEHHIKLFDPAGSYSRCRKAVQTDIKHGRPAIPLLFVGHCLTSFKAYRFRNTILGLVNRLETIRPDDTRSDGCIYWDKFSRFAEIVSVISECRGMGPPVSGEPSDAFRRTLQEMYVITDEEVR